MVEDEEEEGFDRRTPAKGLKGRRFQCFERVKMIEEDVFDEMMMIQVEEEKEDTDEELNPWS